MLQNSLFLREQLLVGLLKSSESSRNTPFPLSSQKEPDFFTAGIRLVFNLLQCSNKTLNYINFLKAFISFSSSLIGVI